MIVRKGDTVTVMIPTYTADLVLSGGTGGLQSRLQQAGFSVLRIDDSGLPWLGVFSGRGQLLITVVPITSDYASEQDVAGLVAGAAYASGYDINAGASAQIVAQAGAASDAFRNLQGSPRADEPPSLPEIPTSWLLIGGAGVLLLVLIKK